MNILPHYSVPVVPIFLDHFAEGQGEDYISREQVEQFDAESDHDKVYQ